MKNSDKEQFVEPEIGIVIFKVEENITDSAAYEGIDFMDLIWEVQL